MTKIITYAYFRSETDVSENVDDKTIDNPIKRAHEQLKFILGKAFYEQIVAQFVASSFSTDNDALYDPYIKKFLAWQAYEFYAIRANVYESRTGFRTFREDNSEVVSESTMANIINEAKHWTQYYKGEMLTFIKQQRRIDSSKYPLYDDCHNKMGTGFNITAVKKKKNERF